MDKVGGRNLYGCYWCGKSKGSHYQQWHENIGWHVWEPPDMHTLKKRIEEGKMFIGPMPQNMPEFVTPFKTDGVEVQDNLGRFVGEMAEEALADEVVVALNDRYSGATDNERALEGEVVELVEAVMIVRDKLNEHILASYIPEDKRGVLRATLEYMDSVIASHNRSQSYDD